MLPSSVVLVANSFVVSEGVGSGSLCFIGAMSRQGGKLFYSSGGPSTTVYDPVGWISQPSVGGLVAIPVLMPQHN